MKFALAVLMLLLFTPTVFAVKTGNCTGVYLETGPNHVPGLIQTGDVFEYWCELPQRARADSTVDVTLTYPNAQLVQALVLPRTLFGVYAGVFP